MHSAHLLVLLAAHRISPAFNACCNLNPEHISSKIFIALKKSIDQMA
jgi:hypothetical protein